MDHQTIFYFLVILIGVSKLAQSERLEYKSEENRNLESKTNDDFNQIRMIRMKNILNQPDYHFNQRKLLVAADHSDTNDETLLQLVDELIAKTHKEIDYLRAKGRIPYAIQLESFLNRVFNVRSQLINTGCDQIIIKNINSFCSNLYDIVKALNIELDVKIAQFNRFNDV